MYPFASHQDHVRDLRAQITAYGVREAVFQIFVPDIGRQIPDNNAVIIPHHLVDLFFSYVNVYFSADVIFIPAGIHLLYQIAGIPVPIDHQQFPGLIQPGIDESGAEYPYYNDNKLNQRHLHHRPRIQKPAVDQGDLEIRHHIGAYSGKDH